MQWNKIFNLTKCERCPINNNFDKNKCFLIKNREINRMYKRINYLYMLQYQNKIYLLTDKTKKYFNDINNIQINNFYQYQNTYIIFSKLFNKIYLYIPKNLKHYINEDKDLQRMIYHYYNAWK